MWEFPFRVAVDAPFPRVGVRCVQWLFFNFMSDRERLAQQVFVSGRRVNRDPAHFLSQVPDLRGDQCVYVHPFKDRQVSHIRGRCGSQVRLVGLF